MFVFGPKHVYCDPNAVAEDIHRMVCDNCGTQISADTGAALDFSRKHRKCRGGQPIVPATQKEIQDESN